jgi:Sigma 54 modulation/S30EA ribosomal protein C terminus
MADTQAMQIQAHAQGAVPKEAMDLAVRRVRSLLRLAPEPVLFVRVRLTLAADPAVERPAIAQANIDLGRRIIRAQATARTLREATERMHDRLRIRMERAARNWAAVRGGQPLPGPHEWRHQSLPAPRMPYFPRPLAERTVIRHKSYSLARQTPEEAAADLELLDYDFHLFTEKATGQDSVIYRIPDGYRLAQAHPRPGRLGPVDASITISERPAPRMTPDDAAARLEALGQPFLFFVDSGTGRGNLIYHRYDGHYGLITPVGS